MPRYTYTINETLVDVAKKLEVVEVIVPCMVHVITGKALTIAQQTEVGIDLCTNFTEKTGNVHYVSQIMVRKIKVSEDNIQTTQVKRR